MIEVPQKYLNQLLLILDLLFQLGVHFVVLVLPVFVVIDLPSICLILTTSRMLLVLGVPIDSLHHNVTVLRIDPIVRVDVLLDSSARSAP